MNLYQQVEAQVRQFLPPSEDAGRFIARQCQSHLHIEPSALNTSHLPVLARWIGVSASLLIPKEKALVLRQGIEKLSASA